MGAKDTQYAWVNWELSASLFFDLPYPILKNFIKTEQHISDAFIPKIIAEKDQTEAMQKIKDGHCSMELFQILSFDQKITVLTNNQDFYLDIHKIFDKNKIDRFVRQLDTIQSCKKNILHGDERLELWSYS